jgi:hypothetical protein
MIYDSRALVAVLTTALSFSCGTSSDPEDGTGASVGDTESSDSTGSTGSSTGPSAETGEETSDDAEETGDTGIDDDRVVWELRAGGFSPPAFETWYSCFSFQLEVEQLHHVIGFEAQVSSPYVHHYVLSLSRDPVDLDPAQPCISWPAGIVWAWAPGIEPMNLPEEAGFLVGDTPGGIVTFVMQVHYNNPLQQAFSDDDGIDVIVTPELRPNDAGIFSQGDIATLSIPPGQTAYEHVARCGSAQTASLLDHEIHVFSSFLHMHEIGAAISSELFRDDALVGPIAVDDPYDFNQQKFLPSDISIQPGDEIATRCVYDSSDRTSTTPGGVASEEEMCINFMMYYPKVTGEKCGSI